MRIDKAKTTAVVIDIQERLLPVMCEKDDVLKNCKILVQGLQELDVPVVFTQQYTKGLGETVHELSELISDFTFVEKTSFSCYDEPAFVEQLEEIQRPNVIIVGIEAHVCVLQTAVDLKEAGYNPIVVTNGISSRSALDKEIALERFKYEGIMLATYESILFELTKGAKSNGFRAISKLVK